MKICISGLYSGTNPQPGVGVGRSLRSAYPSATLVGVEYSQRCSGIHWNDFDDVILQPGWEDIDLESYGLFIKELLDSGTMWISGVDLEIMWLASVFPNGHPNLLTPAASALERIRKPAVQAHSGLPVKIPDFISTEAPDWDLHGFCRQHGWRVWLKGPYYEAVRTPNWEIFERTRSVLSEAWSTDKLFLQAHISGYEESICFCAYQGELVEAVYMSKRELTEEGKTWAGEVVDLPYELATPVRQIVRDLNWSGGAEFEMVRDTGGQLWLLECNPRFPAWIHGATITGRNLPAALVERVTGNKANRCESTGDEFTRVVLEIPLRDGFPLPSLAEPFPNAIGHSLKHPSGTLILAERLQQLNLVQGNTTESDSKPVDASNVAHQHSSSNANGKWNAGDNDFHGERVAQSHEPPQIPDTFIADLNNVDIKGSPTPSWLFFESTAASLFKQASELANKFSSPDLQVSNGYSIKTNPDSRLIHLALDNGFLAEAISLTEVQTALDAGFKPGQIVLNGPGKWWPPVAVPTSTVHAVFADSVSDFKRLIRTLDEQQVRARFVGIRLKPPNTPSRFGIPIDTPQALNELVEMIDSLPRKHGFGIHFHMASSNIGIRQWWYLFESMLRWCRSIEQLARRPIECLDLGGGWFPDDWHFTSPATFQSAIARAQKTLPNVQEIISEPGKALAQPTMGVAMRLLEITGSQSQVKEAVVDGSIAELPMHSMQPHRILHLNSAGEWVPLRRGRTRLLGRLCMEDDVVAANVELPPHIQTGDVLVFCDAGAYDRSMSYDFGRG